MGFLAVTLVHFCTGTSTPCTRALVEQNFYMFMDTWVQYQKQEGSFFLIVFQQEPRHHKSYNPGPWSGLSMHPVADRKDLGWGVSGLGSRVQALGFGLGFRVGCRDFWVYLSPQLPTAE